MRKEFSNYTKAQAILRAAGKCEGTCGGTRLMAGKFHYDHIIPDAMGGEPTLDNCAVLCKSCHGTKTHESDVPNIAKAKRRERKHQGIRKRSSFPCSRDSAFKKKIDGTVERR